MRHRHLLSLSTVFFFSQVTVGFNYSSPNGESIRNAIDSLGNVVFPTLNAAVSVAMVFASPSPNASPAPNPGAPMTLNALMTIKPGPTVASSSTYNITRGVNMTGIVTLTGPDVITYGASKLAGERALAASGAGHLIFRTSWVYGAQGKNFLLTILKLAREREILRVVDDQHGAPTWSRDLAAMTASVIAQCEAAANGRSLVDALAQTGGIYHAAGHGETTWHGFAAEAVRLLQEREPDAKLAKIEAIPTAEYPTPAKRPANSRMNCNKLAERFGWKMMDWRESLKKVLGDL